MVSQKQILTSSKDAEVMKRYFITIMKFTTNLKDGYQQWIYLFLDKKCSVTFGLEM